MRRFILMLTLAAIITVLMGMSALPARAEITNGSCDYSVDGECGGGGGGYDVTTAQQCYSACISDGQRLESCGLGFSTASRASIER
jgi:hypothetical protein